MSALHRPWLVSIPPLRIGAGDTLDLPILRAARGTPSFRKLSLTRGEVDRIQIVSFKVGTVELCDHGPFPGFLFAPDQPELFDIRVEAGCPIAIVVENLANCSIFTAGALLGL